LLPLKKESLIKGIEQTMGAGAKENIIAFELGRKLVLDPSVFSDDKQPVSLEKLIEKKAHYLSGSRAIAFRDLAHEAKRTLSLDEQLLRDLTVRLADLIWFDGPNYAKQYLTLVQSIYSRDSEKYEYEATRAVIWNLAKVMLIKDEVYVAHLLTSKEKLERDCERYDVDESRGDSIRYSHINRPRFDIGKFKIEFDIRTYNWQLNIMKRMKFLRKLLSQWHQPEKEFRDWYILLLSRFQYTNEAEYQIWLDVLKSVDAVTGYREIRHPKQDAAKKMVEQELARLPVHTVASATKPSFSVKKA
jgi:indolepyruvate ferredoxin oxidoreductase